MLSSLQAESSEKNHRKLMKHLRDYDKALDTTVISVLEQNFAEGVRAITQTQANDHEPITTIPGDFSIFPIIAQGGNEDKASLPREKIPSLTYSRKHIHEISSDDWHTAGLSDSVDKYVLKISHYAKRMKTLSPRDDASSYNAAIIANDMTDAIFSRIKTLREPKTTKQVKQRALVDLFKCLKEQGYSSMKWSVPTNIRDPHAMLQLPVPSSDILLSSWDKSSADALEKAESYFHRSQVEITRLRFEISMFGSQYMGQREMTLMQGYSDYILFMICQQRSMISSMIQSVADIQSVIHCYSNTTDDMPLGQKELSAKTIRFEKSFLSLIENIHQVVLLIKESLPLVEGEATRGHVHDSIAILTSCASTLEESYAPSNGVMPITTPQIQQIGGEISGILGKVKEGISSCKKVCTTTLPTSIFDSCLEDVDRTLIVALSFKDGAKESGLDGSNHSDVGATIKMISSLVQSTLLAVQSVCSSDNDQSSVNKDEDLTSTLGQSHREMLKELSNLRLTPISTELSKLSNALIGLHNNSSANGLARSLCTKTMVSSLALVQNVLQISKARLCDSLLYFHKHSKFLYVLLRVFRVLISKGFCSDDVSDGGEGDGEGGAGEMKFEDDVEGTGMGEGDGKNDVTDELENEEQLLGLKGDEDQEAASSQERKELKEDEVDTGMEMEADFEGEKFDLPDQPEDQNDDANSENEEELDRVSFVCIYIVVFIILLNTVSLSFLGNGRRRGSKRASG